LPHRRSSSAEREAVRQRRTGLSDNAASSSQRDDRHPSERVIPAEAGIHAVVE
jgi:hypothetical protein